MKKIILGSFIALTVALLGWGATDNVNAASVYDNPRYYDTLGFHCSSQPASEATFISDIDIHTVLDNSITSGSLDNVSDYWSSRGIYYLSDLFNPDEYYWAWSVNDIPSEPSGRNATLIFAKKSRITDPASFYRFTENPSQFYNGTRYAIPAGSSTVGFDQVKIRSTSTNSTVCSNISNLTITTSANDVWSFNFKNGTYYFGLGFMFPDYRGTSGVYNGLYVSTFPFESPLGFEGSSPPGIGVESVNYVPNWYVSGAVDWKVQIHDINFNTFDNIPFLCDDDLAPVLHWELWDRGDPDDPNDHTLLDDGYFSATAQIDYQLPKLEELKHYRIIGYYECGDAPTFDSSSFHDFKVDQGGNLDRSIALDCIIPEFPFINFRHCQLIIEQTINILIVGDYGKVIENPSPGGGGWTIDADECHTLTVFGDWLNIDSNNRTLCPQFSSTVRDTISPFVGFFLGLGTVIFIARRASGDSQ